MDWVVPLGRRSGSMPSRMFSEFVSLPLAARGFRVLHLPSFAGSFPPGTGRIVTVHDLAFLAEPGWFPPLRRLYYRCFFPRIARRAHRVIADSDFTAGEAVRLLGVPAKFVRTVYLSKGKTGDDRGLPDFRSSAGISGEYALCACTMEPRKNIGVLLDAWQLLRQRRPGAVLVLIGRWGWGEAGVRNRLLNSPGVVWLGSVPRSLLNSAMACARFLVYPSLYEGFGLPPLEAAALGTPSVLGPAESLREIYGGVARFSGADALSLSEAMLAQFDDRPDPDVLRDFAGGFSDGKLARGTADVYRELLV